MIRVDDFNLVLNNISKIIKKCEQSKLLSFTYQDSLFSIGFSKGVEELDCSIKNVSNTNINYSGMLKLNDVEKCMDEIELKDVSQEGKNEREDIVIITSPFVGTIELSNQIKLENSEIHVNKSEMICSIEAMKIYNDIKSPVTGTIVEVMVKDRSLVEYEQPIVKIRVDENE